MTKVISKALVEEALYELKHKSEAEIETETALRWAARAMAAYLYANERPRGGSRKTVLEYFAWGEDLYHEALEHAALVRDHGALVSKIQDQVDPLREGLLRAIR